eukprot:4934449-Pyramimonas_sp.AAC.1
MVIVIVTAREPTEWGGYPSKAVCERASAAADGFIHAGQREMLTPSATVYTPPHHALLDQCVHRFVQAPRTMGCVLGAACKNSKLQEGDQ